MTDETKTPQPDTPVGDLPKEKIYLITETQLGQVIDTYQRTDFPARTIFPAIVALTGLPVHYNPALDDFDPEDIVTVRTPITKAEAAIKYMELMSRGEAK